MTLNAKPFKQARLIPVRGMTVPELMVAIGVGALVLMVMGLVFTSSGRIFAELGNYISMDRRSRSTLDHMTMRIRQARSLTSFGPTHLTFDYDGAGTTLTYDYDEDAGVLTEQLGSKVVTNLTGCDRLAFALYNRDSAATVVATEAKIITVCWKCSDTVLGKKMTTEDMQQAQIVLRNQP